GFTSLMTTFGKICVAIGFLLLIVFAYYETRVNTPAFNMRLFKNMKFTSSNIAALCSYLAVAALTTILNYHFQYVRGWNAQMAGLILIVTPIIMAFMAPNSGKLSDRIHPQKLAAIGMSIATVALLILTFLNADTPVYFVIPFLVLCIILMITKIPQEWKTYEKDKIDKVGSILYAIGILAFIYGFTTLITTSGKILTAAGIVLLIIFGIYELKQASPVFNMKLFKNRKFTSSNVAALCSYLAIMVVTTILNYHFQYVRGWDAQMSGMILIITPIIMAIMAPNAGKLSDKIHPQKLAALGIGIAAVALAILTFLTGDTPLYVVILAMILQGLGMGLFSSPNMNAIMSSVPPKDAPTASASQATMRTIGQTMSLGLLTLVFAWIMGNLELAPQYASMIVQSSQIICGICTCACILAVFASLVGIKSSDKFNTDRPN
ncbi:MFS transporter, partial [Methanobrevibacter sp.]|uniref:MFS transporter n=1 Tax=Methanobrevibacter sp. TaxID=66852 RepID=UPI0038900EF1